MKSQERMSESMDSTSSWNVVENATEVRGAKGRVLSADAPASNKRSSSDHSVRGKPEAMVVEGEQRSQRKRTEEPHTARREASSVDRKRDAAAVTEDTQRKPKV